MVKTELNVIKLKVKVRKWSLISSLIYVAGDKETHIFPLKTVVSDINTTHSGMEDGHNTHCDPPGVRLMNNAYC